MFFIYTFLFFISCNSCFSSFSEDFLPSHTPVSRHFSSMDSEQYLVQLMVPDFFHAELERFFLGQAHPLFHHIQIVAHEKRGQEKVQIQMALKDATIAEWFELFSGSYTYSPLTDSGKVFITYPENNSFFYDRTLIPAAYPAEKSSGKKKKASLKITYFCHFFARLFFKS